MYTKFLVNWIPFTIRFRNSYFMQTFKLKKKNLKFKYFDQ